MHFLSLMGGGGELGKMRFQRIQVSACAGALGSDPILATAEALTRMGSDSDALWQ